MFEQLHELGTRMLDFVYPPQCAVCDLPLLRAEYTLGDRKSSHPAALAPLVLCPYCSPEHGTNLRLTGSTESGLVDWTIKQVGDSRSRPFASVRLVCSRCGEPCAGPDGKNDRCPLCAIAPLGAVSLRSIWRYTDEVEEVIKAFKYRDRRTLAPYLSAVVTEVARLVCYRCDLVVPIPSSRATLAARGFSPTVIFARAAARELKSNLAPRALVERRRRAQQATLPIPERAHNMREVFVARPEVCGATILLIDDVVTSGSTIEDACRALDAAGAREVHVLTLARSPQFVRNRVTLMWKARTSLLRRALCATSV